MAIKIAVANQKGGVGKSTLTRELAAACALSNYRVLMIDCDPQGNLTNSWIENITDINPTTLAQVLIRQTAQSAQSAASGQAKPDLFRLSEAVTATKIPNLDLVGTDYRLINLEKEPSSTVYRLRTEIKTLEEHYDLIFLDCPPNLGNALESALIAADYVLIPCSSTAMGLEGLSQLVYTVERIGADINPDIKILGAVINFYKARRALAQEVLEAVKNEINLVRHVFEQTVSDYAEIGEAPIAKLSVLLTAPNSLAAGQIQNLTAEFLKRLGLPRKRKNSRQKANSTQTAQSA